MENAADEHGLVLAEKCAEEGDLVVAVDFGTSRTAIAYTIVGHDNELVNVEKLSGATSHASGGHKTSTSVLLEDGKVVAFGFQAEERFADEDRPSSADWMLFKWFKMNLHEPSESDPFVHCFGGGQRVRLSEILQKSLEYLTADVLNHLKLERVIPGEDTSNVFWVLTVPAIWSHHARYVMRRAALKAGLIDCDQSVRLLLALEPECAAIASQMDPIQRRLWGVGTKFLIADCGGGTLDITSHEVVESSPLKLKELATPMGGAFGSTAVDKKFLKFFEELVGKDNLELLREEFSAEYLTLLKEWESKKVTFTFDESNNAWIKLKVADAVDVMEIKDDFGSMIDVWNEENPDKVVERLSKNRIKLSLSFNLMVSFFQDSVSNIVDQIDNAVGMCWGLGYIVMAGGFSNCVYLQEKVRERFIDRSIEVIVACDPDLLIVKGAAMFGARPAEVITTRKSRYTFGVLALTQYDERHETHRKYKDKTYVGPDGKTRLDLFCIHGRVGDDLDDENQVRKHYWPVTPDQRKASFTILVTKEQCAFHPSEEGVRSLTSIDVPFDMSLPFEDRKVYVEFSFGGTEVRCIVFNATGDTEVGSLPIHINFHT